MSTGRQLVTELEGLGARLWEDAGQLRFRAPRGVMTDQRRELLRTHRDDVLACLRDGVEAGWLQPDPAARYEPFPLTDVQAAYLLGRRDTFAYGGVACHGYGELSFADLVPERMTRAWRALIARHEMLRAVIEADGSQRVLEKTPRFEVGVRDVRGADPAEVTAAIEATRAELDHRTYQPATWPLFDARITRADDRAVLHVSIDFLVADFVSIQILLAELHQLYQHPDRPLPPLAVTYRDYLLAERGSRSGARSDRAREYWWARLDQLPPAPELPVLERTPAGAPVRFRRWAAVLEPAQWAALTQRARRCGVSPSTAVLAAYAEVIGRWSRGSRFTLDVTLLNRQPLHPQVGQLIGDFTAVELLAVEPAPTAPLAERAAALQAQLWRDLDHRACTGVEVLREISRRHGADAALFPVVYTSAIGLGEAGPPDATGPGELGYGISQTPQVWIDCQNIERHGALVTNWDVREGVFPPGLVEDMFAAYEALLRRMSTEDEVWREAPPLPLPPAQQRRRREVNATAAPVPDGLLHDGVVAQAARTPDRVAVITPDRSVSYAELLGAAAAVADRLVAAGCRPGELVAIVAEHGVDQLVAVLGTLLAGGAYLPVDTTGPAARRESMMSAAGVRFALTQSPLAGAGGWPAGVATIAVDEAPAAGAPAAPLPRQVAPDDLAYTIFTSGSTGVPKGVMVSHRSALNTVADINRRFGVDSADRVLGLSQLGFDLSVYDIFGPLAAGGCLVLPAADRWRDPSHWADLVAEHRVTLWNSVPAQLQMLYDYLTSAPMVTLPTLRLGLLSGDWIPVGLPDQLRQRIPGLRLVSLGGATEAAIWSIYHPIERVAPHWRSIPYGRPLANQTFHVLDASLYDCPDWTVGDLYIGGSGLALGYLGDEAKTAERFIRHPRTGQRLYRTGDLGRYLPDGEIEFLGREDNQVKIRGYRIELAEIEAALQSYPAVGGATVLVAGDRPLERRLVAFVEPARRRPADRPGSGAGPVDAVRDDVTALAAAIGAEVFAGVDRSRYRAFTHQLDRVALLAMVRTLRAAGLFGTPAHEHTAGEVLAAAAVDPRHQGLVRRWLRALASEGVLDRDQDGRYRRSGAPPAWATAMLADPAGGMAGGWARVSELAEGADARLLPYFQACSDQLDSLLRGEEDPLSLLFPDGRTDVTRQLYEETGFNRWANRTAGAAVRRAAEQRLSTGPLRVLEAGAGGGGTSAVVLSALDGYPGGVDYLYTDLSPFFLNLARERFADRPGVRFGGYDLDQDYRGQGLVPNSFDVIVAGDVLHATRHLGRVLGRLRELLAPGGWLVLTEMTRDHYQIMTSLELLVRAEDGNPGEVDERRGDDQIFLGRDAWRRLLAESGADFTLCLPPEPPPPPARPGPSESPEPTAPGVGELLADLGMCVFLARFKSDRAPVDAADLRRHLGERLPEYMLPQSVQVVDALPLTENGKVDRRALRGWLPARVAEPVPATGAAPDSELERQLAAVWAEALRVERVGRDDNLFDLGGDSLVAAQLTGRLLAEIPQAGGLFFDELLRQLLEAPTVGALTSYLVDAGRREATEPQPEEPEETAAPASGDGRLVRLGGGDAPGPAIVLVPNGTGDLTPYRQLVEALRDHPAPVLGFPAAGALIGEPTGRRLERLAADYARTLRDAGHQRVGLVGHGLGGLLAVEVARAFTETGGEVVALTVVAGYRLPGPVDDAVAGELFAAEVGADPGGQESPAGRDAFRAMLAAVTAHEPSLYAGDLTVVRPTGWPSGTEPAADLWGDLCLGELSVVDIAADHAGCLRTPSVALLAALLARSEPS